MSLRRGDTAVLTFAELEAIAGTTIGIGDIVAGDAVVFTLRQGYGGPALMLLTAAGGSIDIDAETLTIAADDWPAVTRRLECVWDLERQRGDDVKTVLTGDVSVLPDVSRPFAEPTWGAIAVPTPGPQGPVGPTGPEGPPGADGDGGGSGGAPTDATYLTTTAHAELDNEVVVGAAPGGELGGTWAAPTVDVNHSGSSHAGTQAAAEATAAAALAVHTGAAAAAHAASAVSFTPVGTIAATTTQAAVAEAATDAAAALSGHSGAGSGAHAATAVSFTPVGTIAATTTQAAVAEVATDAAAALAAHEADTTAIHGIADTSVLETVSGSQAKVDAAISALVAGAPGALNTLLEIANQLSTDESAVTALTSTVAGKVAKSLYDAQTFLAAVTDDTPVAVTVGADTIVGRKTGGNIAALTPTEVKLILGLVIGTNVQAFSSILATLAGLTLSNDDFIQVKAGVLANRTIAQVQADIMSSVSGEAIIRANTLNQMAAPTSALDVNGQRVTNAADANTASGLATLGQGQPDVQEFTSNGTWTKPAGAVLVLVEGIGAGGGGAGGVRGAAGTSRAGGGGGSAGTSYAVLMAASALGATETVTLGAAGTGGVAATVDATPGGDGGNGADTTIGSVLTIKGGIGASHGGGFTPGAGGYPPPSQLAAGWGGTSILVLALTPTLKGLAGNAGGGGSGQVITAGDAIGVGNNGGDGTGGAAGAGGSVANGAAGSAGSKMRGGGGGGGGASRKNGGGAAYSGGAGGAPGGGGGGGGATLNGQNSGAGGAGGTAYVRITTFR